MKKEEVEKLAKELIHTHLPNRRAKFDWLDGIHRGVLGLTLFATNTIYFDRTYAKLAPYEEVKGTILHEIAHMLVGKELTMSDLKHRGHGPLWKRYARQLGIKAVRMAKLDEDLSERLKEEVEKIDGNTYFLMEIRFMCIASQI